MLPGCTELIQAANQRRQRRVWFDRAFAIRAIGIQIAAWSVRWPDPLRCLLDHALARFLTQVVDEVFRHQYFDAVDELFGGSRFPADDGCLFDEVNLEAADFVDGHPIAEVTVQTGSAAISLTYQ
jgi:hypothetical protein